MSVQIGDLARKRMVKSLSGKIIDLVDETNGGVIISKGQVVNPNRWEEMLKEEEDRKLAAKAQSMQKVDANAPDRNIKPDSPQDTKKVEELETKVNDMSTKLDAILEALKK